MKIRSFIYALSLMATMSAVISCTETDSSLVEFEEENNFDLPSDTVYSVMGIIKKMQVIADRTVLLGEIRGDLTTLTDHATTDLRQLANFEATAENVYNNARDYYAVIQNCNFYIARADTSIKKRNQSVFLKEYAVVKSFRAWTYMQLALNYGKVPFFTQPLLTEKEADVNLYPKYDIKQIADFFINDIKDYVDTDYPSYSSVGGMNSTRFFIPVRALLGDLCLWAGRYQEAAQYYHDYLTTTGNARPIGVNAVTWDDKQFSHVTSSYNTLFNRTNAETLTFIPMEEEEYNGTISYLDDVFNSTEDNNYYNQATRSQALTDLSSAQRYTMIITDVNTQLPDTISPPDSLAYETQLQKGDLRLYTVITTRSVGSSTTMDYSTIRQTISKVTDNSVTIYRLGQIYLRYAEALNRAGYPNAAFAVLKYGLYPSTVQQYVPEEERTAAGDLLTFSQYQFSRDNTIGIHSRGCGTANADTTYAIPSTLTEKADIIEYVEDRIMDEMALEECFEGQRLYELMRVALRRSDNAYLARRIASRDGESNFNDALYQRLLNESNWYLPLE